MARKVLITVRRGLEANLPTLADGELGFTTDTKKFYIGTATGNALLVAAQTAGDMLKSIYDTDNDGIVDSAETVAWAGVTGRPTALSAFTNDIGTVRVTTSAAAPGSTAAGDYWYKVI